MSPFDDDPFAPRDATIIRPRPGGRRRPADPVRGHEPDAASEPARRPEPGEADDLSSSTDTLNLLGHGLNPLVRAASTLLLLAGQLRHAPAMSDVSGLRRQVLAEIRRFEEQARSAGIAREVVPAARYALCATVDEAVLSTPWGAHSDWTQQSLLVALHRDASGGEKFFDMLQRTSSDPSRHIDLLELQFLCLAVGFGGKYHVSEQGAQRLDDIQQGLFRTIRDFRGAPEPALSPRWKGREDRRNPVVRYVPWWVACAAALAVVSLTYIVLYTWLGRAAAPVQAALAAIGTESFRETAARPSGVTLKQLLAPQEAARTLAVEEDGGRTTVTFLAPDLFASGSAALNAAALDTVSRVAEAVRRVPGRVLVTGHTDDQPIRSLRFQDNFALSQARADTVAELLRRGLDVAGRVRARGVGSTEPRYRPESTAENRARNRRVEIVHVAEG
jgi:type VI secretion system protein ImpK